MNSTLRFGLLLIVLAVTAYYAVLHFRVLRIDHPITQDEPGFTEITAAKNPYTENGVENCGSVYGPVYAWWARPFAALFPNPYIAHRWANTVALFLALGVIGFAGRRLGLGLIEISAGLAIVYILNVSSHSIAASTDLSGAALYLAALAVSRRQTWGGLLAGLTLATLATLTKPYFALSWIIVVSHLALFAPPRKLIGYLGVSILAGIMVAGIIRTFAPYYFLSTLLVQATTATRSLSIFLSQTGDFLILAGGIVILSLCCRPGRWKFNRNWRDALVTPPIDLWSWAALVAAAALLVKLAWHPGNYLVYFHHLLLGPLAIAALARFAAHPKLGVVLLGANLLVLGYLLPPQPRNDNWAALSADVAAVQGRVLAEPLLEPFAREHSNVELLSHGQTASVLQVLDQAGPEVPPRYQTLHRKLIQHADALAARIRAQEFSAIYISYQEVGGVTAWTYDQRRVIDALRSRYRSVAEIQIFPYAAPYWDRLRHGEQAYHVVRWEPRASVSAR